MALRDPRRILRERVRRQLVCRSVLPFPSAVRRLAVLLRRDHLRLAASAEAGEDQLVDLASLGGLTGLPRPSLEGAEDASFDYRLKAVCAEGVRAQDRHPLVTPGPRCADKLVMR